VHLEAHTRFLVTERAGDPQAIIGYVNVKDLFFLAKSHPHNPSVREITRPLPTLQPEMLIGDALSRMMGNHLHLALVKDADGVVLGMITLEDVIEEVVGDIQDEFDRLPRSLIPVGRQWVAGGGVSLARIREVLAKPNFGGDVEPSVSLDDWLHTIDPQLHAGTLIEPDGARILVRKTRRDKVMEAVIQPVTSSEHVQTPTAGTV
jgi:putative hemolysin